MPNDRIHATATGPGGTAIGGEAVAPSSIAEDVIQGGEIVILNLRPHVRSVPLRMLPLILVVVALSLAAGVATSWTSAQLLPFVGAIAVGLVAFGFDWSQTRYVLTDRRVMVIRGGTGFGGRVVVEALVPALQRVSLEHSVRESVVGLGTLEFVPDHGEVIRWVMLGRAEDVYAIARDAIERYGRGRLDE